MCFGSATAKMSTEEDALRSTRKPYLATFLNIRFTRAISPMEEGLDDGVDIAPEGKVRA